MRMRWVFLPENFLPRPLPMINSSTCIDSLISTTEEKGRFMEASEGQDRRCMSFLLLTTYSSLLAHFMLTCR